MPSTPVILILSSGPISRNPRVSKEASALGGAGLDVTVMTVANHARSEEYDAELLRGARFRRVALDRISRRGFPGLRSTFGRLVTWVARRAVRVGIQSKQALGPTLALGRMARRFEADLTIVHTEMPFCIGLDLLARGRRVAADFEDWHSQDLLPQSQATRPLRLIENAERELMRRAAYTSATSHAMARALQAAHGGALPVVITNSFPLQPEPAPRPLGGPPSFLWFSQTIGPGRGLELFLAAWSQTLNPSRLNLLGDVGAAYRDKLFRRLPAERRDCLRFLPFTSPDKLPSVIAQHDLGLALEPTLPANKTCTISNKILQYLNAGVAVVASDTAGQREVLERVPGAGILADLSQTGELAAQLDALLSDRRRIVAMGQAARRGAAETYCWEREAPRLLAAVEGALRLPRPAAR